MQGLMHKGRMHLQAIFFFGEGGVGRRRGRGEIKDKSF